MLLECDPIVAGQIRCVQWLPDRPPALTCTNEAVDSLNKYAAALGFGELQASCQLGLLAGGPSCDRTVSRLGNLVATYDDFTAVYTSCRVNTQSTTLSSTLSTTATSTATTTGTTELRLGKLDCVQLYGQPDCLVGSRGGPVTCTEQATRLSAIIESCGQPANTIACTPVEGAQLLAARPSNIVEASKVSAPSVASSGAVAAYRAASDNLTQFEYWTNRLHLHDDIIRCEEAVAAIKAGIETLHVDGTRTGTSLGCGLAFIHAGPPSTGGIDALNELIELSGKGKFDYCTLQSTSVTTTATTSVATTASTTPTSTGTTTITTTVGLATMSCTSEADSSLLISSLGHAHCQSDLELLSSRQQRCRPNATIPYSFLTCNNGGTSFLIAPAAQCDALAAAMVSDAKERGMPVQRPKCIPTGFVGADGLIRYALSGKETDCTMIANVLNQHITEYSDGARCSPSTTTTETTETKTTSTRTTETITTRTEPAWSSCMSTLASVLDATPECGLFLGKVSRHDEVSTPTVITTVQPDPAKHGELAAIALRFRSVFPKVSATAEEDETTRRQIVAYVQDSLGFAVSLDAETFKYADATTPAADPAGCFCLESMHQMLAAGGAWTECSVSSIGIDLPFTVYEYSLACGVDSYTPEDPAVVVTMWLPQAQAQMIALEATSCRFCPTFAIGQTDPATACGSTVFGELCENNTPSPTDDPEVKARPSVAPSKRKSDGVSSSAIAIIVFTVLALCVAVSAGIYTTCRKAPDRKFVANSTEVKLTPLAETIRRVIENGHSPKTVQPSSDEQEDRQEISDFDKTAMHHKSFTGGSDTSSDTGSDDPTEDFSHEETLSSSIMINGEPSNGVVASFGPRQWSFVNVGIELADPLDGAAPLTSPLTGRVGVVERGNCFFVTKVLNVQRAGGLCCIVINSLGDMPEEMTAGGTTEEEAMVEIPAILLPKSEGQALLQMISNKDGSPPTISLSAGSIESMYIGINPTVTAVSGGAAGYIDVVQQAELPGVAGDTLMPHKERPESAVDKIRQENGNVASTKKVPWDIEFTGATGPLADQVNGRYVLSGEQQNGKTVYQRVNNPLKCCWYDPTERWCLSSIAAKDANEAKGYCIGIEPGITSPENVLEWTVSSGTSFTVQPKVCVVTNNRTTQDTFDEAAVSLSPLAPVFDQDEPHFGSKSANQALTSIRSDSTATAMMTEINHSAVLSSPVYPDVLVQRDVYGTESPAIVETKSSPTTTVNDNSVLANAAYFDRHKPPKRKIFDIKTMANEERSKDHKLGMTAESSDAAALRLPGFAARVRDAKKRAEGIADIEKVDREGNSRFPVKNMVKTVVPRSESSGYKKAVSQAWGTRGVGKTKREFVIGPDGNLGSRATVDSDVTSEATQDELFTRSAIGTRSSNNDQTNTVSPAGRMRPGVDGGFISNEGDSTNNSNLEKNGDKFSSAEAVLPGIEARSLSRDVQEVTIRRSEDDIGDSEWWSW